MTTMNEAFLQFVWQHQLLLKNSTWLSTDNQEITILKPGTLNTHAGPDFIHAKVKIGNTTWAGNIEIHVKNSDWLLHQHDNNKAYENIILHVVYDYNKEIPLPCSVLNIKNYIPENIFKTYTLLQQTTTKIPCASLLHQVNTITIASQLERMLYERLEQKTNHIDELLLQYNNHWQEVFYILVCSAFGLHINQDAFENVARSLPLKIISKHKSNLFQLESLLFGQAGFLEQTINDPYFLSLKNEYDYLKTLYQLEPIEHHLFKFLRLRPANFPTIRIAQFAALLHSSVHLFSKIIEAKTLEELYALFDISVSTYWHTHFTFRKEGVKHSDHQIGKSYISLMLINAIIPMLYIYGKKQGVAAHCTMALSLLEKIKPEKNALITKMNAIGFKVNNAADTQSILHLKKNYCDQKRCLECSIGFQLLKK